MFFSSGGHDSDDQHLWWWIFRQGRRKLHPQQPEAGARCWWVGNPGYLLAALKDGFKVESHVKIVDINSHEVRIIGAGSYWPQGTDSQVAELNWWHASGDPYGRWVAGDNWHGGIALFDAKTTQKHLLTTGHRTYGRGTHPEVGWDTRGRFVIFGSEYLGNPDVCIVEIPKEWQQ